MHVRRRRDPAGVATTTTTAPDLFVYSRWVVDAGRSTCPFPSVFPSSLHPLGNVAAMKASRNSDLSGSSHGLDTLVRIHITLELRMSGKDPVALEKLFVRGGGPLVENAESFLLVSGCTASDPPSLVMLKWLDEMGAGLARRRIRPSVQGTNVTVSVGPSIRSRLSSHKRVFVQLRDTVEIVNMRYR